MKKTIAPIIAAIACLFLCAPSLAAQDSAASPSSETSAAADVTEAASVDQSAPAGGGDSGEAPDFSSTFLVNCLVPGYAQFATGKSDEGWLCVWGLPLLVAGQSLILAYDYTGGIDIFGTLVDPSLSPYGSSGTIVSKERAALLYGGRALTAAALALYAYSAYSYYEDVFPSGSGRSGFLDLLSAPFDPAVMLRPETGGAILLMASVQLFNNSSYLRFKEFFERPSAPFMGVDMVPWQALTARVATQAALSLFVALGEETLYRGLLLSMDGEALEVALDGAKPLYRLVVPANDAEGVWIDVLAGSGWALYSTALSSASGNPRASVATRFWYGLLFSTIDYVIDPAAASDVGVSIRIVY